MIFYYEFEKNLVKNNQTNVSDLIFDNIYLFLTDQH